MTAIESAITSAVKAKRRFLMGNGAIARGIIEAGCQAATAYPGTPSTEILLEVSRFKKEEKNPIYVEWSINEKIAFDVALASSIMGKRSVAIMKQVGLNVASDSLMSAAYTGVKGGMVVISCDDPGPHSSQTEQDSRLFAIFAKVPVLDPSDPQEAKEMVKYAFDLSEKYRIPVMLRPTTRVSHARSAVTMEDCRAGGVEGKFEKNPQRWAATPSFRLILHRELNEKLDAIAVEFEQLTQFNYRANAPANQRKLCILSGGAVFAAVMDTMDEMGLEIPVLKIGAPYPFPKRIVNDFIAGYERVLVIEETDQVIEAQLNDRTRVLGRSNNFVPRAGELLPDVVHEILAKAAGESEIRHRSPTTSRGEVAVATRPPTMCPACPERAAFFAIKKAFPKAIYPSDIGCYTLGLNMKAVDTVIDMGASITLAGGFYHAQSENKEKSPIVATIGDSTFFHAGIPSLLNAVVTDARFILVILDNTIVAMTGGQTSPTSGRQVDGRSVPQASIEKLVEACGVKFIEVHDPYDVDGMVKILKRAGEHIKSADGGIAVVVARHPCPLYTPGHREQYVFPVEISHDCNGCQYCTKFFECPALIYDSEKNKVFIDYRICTDCGVCISACPTDCIIPKEKAPATATSS